MNRLVAVAILVICAGCAQRATTEQAPTIAEPAMRAFGQRIEPDTSHSDQAIGLEVRRRLELADRAAMAGVIVEVDGGVVTLTGVVPSLTAAWRAEAAARSVRGVQAVRNIVLISGGGGGPP